jgi:integrase
MSKSYEHGFEIHRLGRRIEKARFKYGSNPQKWEWVKPQYLGSLHELKEYKTIFLAELRGGNGTMKPRYEGTFGEFWPEALQAFAKGLRCRKLKPSTIRTYTRCLSSNWLLPLQNQKLSRIDQESLTLVIERWERLLAEDDKELHPKTLESYLTPVQKVFTYAIKTGKFRAANPVKTIGFDRNVSRPKPYIYSAEDMARFFDAFKDRYQFFLRLAYGGGLRRNELLGLRWRHFNLDGDEDSYMDVEGQFDPFLGEIIMGTKGEILGGEGGRQVDINPALFPWIEFQKSLNARLDPMTGRKLPKGITRIVQDDEPVFLEITKNVASTIRRVSDELGSPFDGSTGHAPMTLHKLRHNFGSQLASNGASAQYVAQQMGDTVETVNRVYIHEFTREHRDRTRSTAAIMGRVMEAIG